jgi:hypothetical protein
MHQAGWSAVWHTVLALIAQEPPFAQIAIVTGAAFVIVMALEGMRASVSAMIHAHRAVPVPVPLEAPKPEPVELAAAPSRSFNIPRAMPIARPKRSAAPLRKFRELRPIIRRNAT